jgi:hypothetical protein
MGLFDGKDKPLSDGEQETLREQIAGLRTDVATLIKQKEAGEDVNSLIEERNALKQEVTDQRIELDRVAEDKARAEREIEHKLGLHRTQVEAERKQMEDKAEADRERAVAEARIAVREENLTASTERLEQQAEFQKESMEREMASLRALTGQILERLPTFKFNRNETVGSSPALEAGDE